MAAERPWILEETRWPEVRDAAYEIALLPWGATEAHNTHLPYGTDTIEAATVARAAAALAWQRGARVVTLPAVPFGVHTAQLDIPLCLNMNPSTQALLLADLIRTIERTSVRKLVIVNGHGGNDFRQIIRELQPNTRLLLCTLNWYAAADARAHFDEPGDHAGELETSVMQHIAADLVAPLHTAGAGHARPFAVRALREGWAWTPRQWTQVTDDTGVGNPSGATATKGATFLAATTGRIADFLVELAAADPDHMYQDDPS